MTKPIIEFKVEGVTSIPSKEEVVTRFSSLTSEDVAKETSPIVGSVIDRISELEEVKAKYSNPEIYAAYLVSEVLGVTLENKIPSENQQFFAMQNSKQYSSNRLLSNKEISSEEKECIKEIFGKLNESSNNSYEQFLLGIDNFYAFTRDSRDRTQVIHYFLKSAQNENNANSISQLHLADIMKTGEIKGIDKDKDFFQFYEKSANQGNREAQYAIALCYLNGEGTNRNKEESLKWLKQSADQNHTPAIAKLGISYEKSGNFEDAFKFLSKGADLGSIYAKMHLARYYYEGYGVVEKDLNKSLGFFEEVLVGNTKLASEWIFKVLSTPNQKSKEFADKFALNLFQQVLNGLDDQSSSVQQNDFLRQCTLSPKQKFKSSDENDTILFKLQKAKKSSFSDSEIESIKEIFLDAIIEGKSKVNISLFSLAEKMKSFKNNSESINHGINPMSGEKVEKQESKVSTEGKSNR